MKSLDFCRYALGIGAAAAILGGCGGNQSTTPQLPATSVQAPHALKPSPRHARYKLIDLGTFGGPSSSVFSQAQYILNDRGVITGVADTSVSDPNYPYTNPFFALLGSDPYIQHAFKWQSGGLEDLGALPGVNSSYSLSISNNASYAAGVSTNGTIDPLTGYVEGRAVVWKDGRITDIGTFGGNESFASQASDRGEVAGSAANPITDPYNSGFNGYGWGTQMHAFLWQNRTAKDLGTLGGPDSIGLYVNQNGQVAGFSYTSYMPNQGTGVPTVHPFLWEPRTTHMRDLGTIGGTLVFGLNGLNVRGDVIGNMTVAGDQDFHAFLWNGKHLLDLGTFGGSNSNAEALNDRGVAVGEADYPSGCSGPAQHAALWKNGRMTDLGVLPDTLRSSAFAVNSSDQVVGFSLTCDYSSGPAFLWEHGSMVDLNTLVSHHPNFYMFWGLGIDDRGEITGLGVTSNTTHAFALIPCLNDSDLNGPANACDAQISQAPRPITFNPAIRALLRGSHFLRTRLVKPSAPIP
jgi:probable HAF family extracellular repeat protein